MVATSAIAVVSTSFSFLCFCASISSAFIPVLQPVQSPTASARFDKILILSSTSNGDVRAEEHPAVVGWPEKYAASGGNIEVAHPGPKIISNEFDVHKATESELIDLDAKQWPTWTTGDKPKWQVGNQVTDKEMPYGELSYVISGKLEIIPQSTGESVIIDAGDLVTFPKGFVASWKVLEELTWHYYLY